MTYHHFFNVAALAFAPYWIFYKARICAQSEVKSILVGAGFYLFAQFIELITLATFVSGGSDGQTTVHATGNLLHVLQVILLPAFGSHVLNCIIAAAARACVAPPSHRHLAVKAHRTHPRRWPVDGFSDTPQ